MGERPVWEVADRLRKGEPIRAIRDVRGTAFAMRKGEWEQHRGERVRDRRQDRRPAELRGGRARQARLRRDVARVPVRDQPGQRAPARSSRTAPRRSTTTRRRARSRRRTWTSSTTCPSPASRTSRTRSGIPAYETVKHSIVTMRGCFGGCTFCSITEHEGRVIQSRSAESILREVRALRRMDDFRGTITDLGGPTANMYQMKCKDEGIEKRVPPHVLRLPRGLREPGHRPRAAPPADEGGAGGGGRAATSSSPPACATTWPSDRPSSSPSSPGTTPAASSRSRPSTAGRTCSTG